MCIRDSVVTALVVEVLMVVRDAPRLWHGAGPEHGPKLFVQVDEVGLVEAVPRRQRYVISLGQQLVVDDAALTERKAVHEHGADHATRARVDGAMDDGATAGMA